MSAEKINIDGEKEILQDKAGAIYEQLKAGDSETGRSCEEWHSDIFATLREADGPVWELIAGELQRRSSTLQLLAAENQCSKAVLAALGSVVQNKTAEGTVAARLHGGSGVIDRLEQLAIIRAREVFGAKYANVQPHSGTQANQIVIMAVLQAGDKILSMSPGQGGHYSHGSENSIAGRFFEVENYYLDKEDLLLNYDAIREKALRFRPKLIICGASAYPRSIDFGRFRQIADEAGAFLLADISHLSAFVAAGVHQSPVDFAHFTTTSTYKPGGPRGGLILMGKDFDNKIGIDGQKKPLWQLIDQTTFPCVQGTPYFNNIAAKAVFFNEMMSDEYRDLQFKTVENSKRLCEELIALGFDVITGGTDNHMVIVDVGGSQKGLTGKIAQKMLEQCGIVTDKVPLPYKRDSAKLTGIRMGTAIVTRNGMAGDQMEIVALIIDEVLRHIEIDEQGGCKIDEQVRIKMLEKVGEFCRHFSQEKSED